MCVCVCVCVRVCVCVCVCVCVRAQNVTALERRKLLISTFGSRKKQNLQKSREAGRVDAHNVTSGDAVTRLLSKTASAVAVPDSGWCLGLAIVCACRSALFPFFPWHVIAHVFDVVCGICVAPAESAAAAQAATRSMLLPPCNPEAKAVEDAYPANECMLLIVAVICRMVGHCWR